MDENVDDYLHSLADAYFVRLDTIAESLLTRLRTYMLRDHGVVCGEFIKQFETETKNYDFAKKTIQALKNTPNAT